ncbi:MAG: phosphate-starvation-inducible protein PsiE [Thiotrichales bacterium]|nr:phosphate-starvation-inducible protein PsiE [Thiotrichales bacterium]
MKQRFSWAVKIGDNMVEVFHLLGLFVVGATIAWSAVAEYIGIMEQGHASLGDILLLFIFLELGAMIGVFFRTHRIPVIFLLFIAITAMTRFLAIDVKVMEMQSVIMASGSILILCIAVLVLQYSSNKFSSKDETEA